MVGIMDGCFALEKATMVKLSEKLGIVNSQPVGHNAFKKLSDHDLEFSGQFLLVQALWAFLKVQCWVQVSLMENFFSLIGSFR
jgi:hypothetical protein